jgi:hypothetical protein
MPSKNEPELLVPRVQSSFQQLSAAAATLNTASDRLSKLVAELDSVLKPLNVGIDCWVDIGPVSMSPDGSGAYSEQIGYTKTGGKWGIALRTVEEFFQIGEHSIKEWAFSEAPRELRLRGIDCIPDLLDELAKDAAKTTKEITEKTDEVQRLVSALKGSVSR